MSDFGYEQAGEAPPEPAAEQVAPPPSPVEGGFASPDEVTRAFAAEAQRIKTGEPPPAVAPEPAPLEPPASVEQPALDQAQVNAWVQQAVDERVQQGVVENLDREISSLLEQGYSVEQVSRWMEALPEQTRQALAERNAAFTEAVEFSELMATEAMAERAQATVDEGVAELRQLVDSWNAEAVGAAPVDVARVYELALERWPGAAAQVGESQEVAVGLLKQAFDEVAAEQQGEQTAFQLIENEGRKLGVELDVLRVKGIADALWPQIARQFGGDEQEAARAAISAAVALETNFATPQSAESVTRFYGERARQIRRGQGQVDGAPPARAPERDGPSEVTRRFALEAAAIKARSGQP